MISRTTLAIAVFACHIVCADEVADYRAAIDELETLYGAYDPGLSELHYGLGRSLQQQDKHSEALDILKRAMHLTRVNEGINSIAQEPMLRSLLESHKALDHTTQTAIAYQQLVSLYKRTHGETSPQLVPLLMEAGSWHREKYLQQQTPDAFAHLQESTALTASAVSISRIHFGSVDPQLLGPLQALIKDQYYLTRYYQQFPPTPPRSYINQHGFSTESRFAADNAFGRGDRRLRQYDRERRLKEQYRKELIQKHFATGLDAYRDITAIHTRSGDVKQQATALTEQGDWLALYGESPVRAPRHQAVTLYSQSWHMLSNAGDQQTLDQLFGQPKLLPGFDNHHRDAIPDQLARVQFDLNPDGKASNIKVLEIVSANRQQTARRARQKAARSQFRSRIVDGRPVASKNIELNFFIEQQQN